MLAVHGQLTRTSQESHAPAVGFAAACVPACWQGSQPADPLDGFLTRPRRREACHTIIVAIHSLLSGDAPAVERPAFGAAAAVGRHERARSRRRSGASREAAVGPGGGDDGRAMAASSRLRAEQGHLSRHRPLQKRLFRRRTLLSH